MHLGVLLGGVCGILGVVVGMLIVHVVLWYREFGDFDGLFR